MNQVEFIKKWAKHEDRVEDGAFKFFVTMDADGDLWFHNTKTRNISSGLNSYLQCSVPWESPRIYRLLDRMPSLMVGASFDGYVENWQLIADYENEKKEESSVDNWQLVADYAKKEESFVEKYVNGLGGMYGDSKEKADEFALLLRDFETRIKALEEKIK